MVTVNKAFWWSQALLQRLMTVDQLLFKARDKYLQRTLHAASHWHSCKLMFCNKSHKYAYLVFH